MFIPRAKRSIKRLSAFKDINEVDDTDGLPFLNVINKEGPIGFYENVRGSIRDNIFFSNKAIYIFCEPNWEKVDYINIDSLIYDGDKNTATTIKLRLFGGKIIGFKILGVENKYRDYFTIYKFLHRIIGDLNKPKGSE